MAGKKLGRFWPRCVFTSQYIFILMHFMFLGWVTVQPNAVPGGGQGWKYLPHFSQTGIVLMPPPTEFEENVYVLFGSKDSFRVLLKDELSKDALISDQNCLLNGEKISKGKLKRVQLQLRVYDGVVAKSGYPLSLLRCGKLLSQNILLTLGQKKFIRY